MVEYTKPWLSLEQQVERLTSRGVAMGDSDRATALLKAIGYYRLTGYLYPFRESEQYVADDGRTRTRVLGDYRPGTTLDHAESIIDFDRRLRMLVLDGVERIEVVSDPAISRYQPRIVVEYGDGQALEWMETQGSGAFRMTWEAAKSMAGELGDEAGVPPEAMQDLAGAVDALVQAPDVSALVEIAARAVAQARRG